MPSREGVDVLVVRGEEWFAMPIVSVVVAEEAIAVLTVEVSDSLELVSLQPTIALLHLWRDDIPLNAILPVDHELMITNLHILVVRHVESRVHADSLIAPEHLCVVTTLATTDDEVGLLPFTQMRL